MVSVRQYLIITLSYWAFTITDGALRMLVVLHFYQLGYTPLQVASLFLFYEFFGIVTNLLGGWLAARLGLAATLISGLLLQIVALCMLLVNEAMLTVAWVMTAQALSGIAKDLNKMSAKSSVKMVAGASAERLFKWVARLTGSKNALKGAGFFLGGLLLSTNGFAGAIAILAMSLTGITVIAALTLNRAMGKTTFKPKFRDLASKSRAVNKLSGARFFLFGARDVWFVVALPVFLHSQLGWSNIAVGTLLALWIIGYGLVQSVAPSMTQAQGANGAVVLWGAVLTCVTLILAAALSLLPSNATLLVVGLALFGIVFALNSAIHSYLIVAYAEADGVTLDVGFYYMSNAAGRLAGTLCSGWIYQAYGLPACLWLSAAFVGLASIAALGLPRPMVGLSR